MGESKDRMELQITTCYFCDKEGSRDKMSPLGIVMGTADSIRVYAHPECLWKEREADRHEDY